MIADAIILFGRMEQEAIEISWLLHDSDLKERLKIARTPASESFVEIIESVEKAFKGCNLPEIKEAFKNLSHNRNLIVHGAWTMVNDKPWVVWHKFIEDTESIVGEFFEGWRFQLFMKSGEHLLNTLRLFHNELEKQTNTKTSAVPRHQT